MKVIFKSIVAILLIIIGSLIALPLFYDIDEIAKNIEGKFSDALQSKIKINGNVTFEIIPSVKIKANNVLISDFIDEKQ